jgi:hypothetical protein
MKNGSCVTTTNLAPAALQLSHHGVRTCSRSPSDFGKPIRSPMSALELSADSASSAVAPTLSPLVVFPKSHLQPFSLRSIIRASQSDPPSKKRNPVKSGKVLVNFLVPLDHRLHRHPLEIENRSDFGQFWTDFTLDAQTSPGPVLPAVTGGSRTAANINFRSSLVISFNHPAPPGAESSSFQATCKPPAGGPIGRQAHLFRGQT